MKAELKKVAADIFKANPDAKFLLSTGDGNFFLPKAEDHAKNHARNQGLDVVKVYPEGKEAAEKEAAEKEAAEKEAAEKEAAEKEASEDNAAKGNESEGESSDLPTGETASAPADAVPAKTQTPKKK